MKRMPVCPLHPKLLRRIIEPVAFCTAQVWIISYLVRSLRPRPR